MRSLVPRTLFGQTLLLLLAGIGLALAAGAWIYASAGQEAVRAVGALAAAERIVNLTRLVSDVPSDWRARIVAGSSDPSFRVALSATKPSFTADADEPPAVRAITDLLRGSLPNRQLVVSVQAGRSHERDGTYGRAGGPKRHGPRARSGTRDRRDGARPSHA